MADEQIFLQEEECTDCTSIKLQGIADAIEAVNTTFEDKFESNKLDSTVVESLPNDPSPNTIYFVPTGDASPKAYTGYMFINGAWEQLGANTSGDFSNYYTKAQVDSLLMGKQDELTSQEITNIIINNVSKSDLLAILGYTETTMAMTDTDGVTKTWSVIAKPVV